MGGVSVTNDEAKHAFFHRSPVLHNGIVYTFITQIIYSLDDYDRLRITLKLADKSRNSYMNAKIEDVTPYDFKNQIPTILP